MYPTNVVNVQCSAAVGRYTGPGSCLLATDGWQIGPHDWTIAPWIADKSTELIIHARHEWPIKRPWDYQTLKDDK